ncbi:hypothetical protein K440DRAFT_502166, partial [Wilcoxina mikolae CBS 423.85]
FLPDYPEQCNTTGIKCFRCPHCDIDPDELPSFNHRPRRHHHQRYEAMSVEAEDTVGLWKFENCRNFPHTHADCNMYTSMNVDPQQQLLNGVFKYHTWEW